MALSERGNVILTEENILLHAWEKTLANSYRPEENPEGIINLGTSENRLMFDVLEEKFKEYTGHVIKDSDTQYNDHKGLKEFRQALAVFLTDCLDTLQPIDPNNLVVQGGCGSVVANLGRVLCNSGEYILTPSPFYGGFQQDFALFDVGIFPIKLTSELKHGETQPFELSLQRVEEAYQLALAQGLTVRAILLTNPNNPLGNIFPEKTVRDCLEFAHMHSLHVIVDEIYFFSVFKEGEAMKSILSLDNIPDREQVHFVWGFSKDFGISGFRCGCVHTFNKDLVKALGQFAYFFSVPTPLQRLLLPLLTDQEWQGRYFKELRVRLRRNYQIFSKGFKEMGIKHLETVAGFFMWVDFREFLQECTGEEEIKLFHRFLDEAGICITPCTAFFSQEHGWFRIIIANDLDSVKTGLKRLQSFVTKLRAEIGS